MVTKTPKLIYDLHKLAGKIGAKATSDDRYLPVYKKLAQALDEAETVGLMVSYNEELAGVELKVIRKHVEKLGLDLRHTLKPMDIVALHKSLVADNEYDLAAYVASVSTPKELFDLITDTVLG